MKNSKRLCQGIINPGWTTLNSNNFDLGVDLIFDHILDGHQGTGQRTRATSASSLVTNPKCIPCKLNDFQPTAIPRKVRPNPFVKERLDLSELRIIGRS